MPRQLSGTCVSVAVSVRPHDTLGRLAPRRGRDDRGRSTTASRPRRWSGAARSPMPRSSCWRTIARTAPGMKASARSGFQFEAGTGSAFYYSYALPQIVVTDPLKVGLYVRSNRVGVQLLGRVVLPADTDPDTGEPSFVLIPGTIYDAADRWQRLELVDLRPSIERQARVLRAASNRPVSLEGAYLDRLVVNLFGGPGRTEVFLDDLTIRPVSTKALAGGAPASPGGLATPKVQAERMPNPRSRVQLEGNRLRKDGNDWLVTGVEAPGADVGALRRGGFDVLVDDFDADPERAREAIERGFLLMPRLGSRDSGGPPDPARVREIATASPYRDSVAFWHLGDHLGSSIDPAERTAEWERIRAVVAGLRDLPPDAARLTTATVSGEFYKYARAPRGLDMIGVRPLSWGAMQDPLDTYQLFITASRIDDPREPRGAVLGLGRRDSARPRADRRLGPGVASGLGTCRRPARASPPGDLHGPGRRVSRRRLPRRCRPDAAPRAPAPDRIGAAQRGDRPVRVDPGARRRPHPAPSDRPHRAGRIWRRWWARVPAPLRPRRSPPRTPPSAPRRSRPATAEGCSCWWPTSRRGAIPAAADGDQRPEDHGAGARVGAGLRDQPRRGPRARPRARPRREADHRARVQRHVDGPGHHRHGVEGPDRGGDGPGPPPRRRAGDRAGAAPAPGRAGDPRAPGRRRPHGPRLGRVARPGREEHPVGERRAGARGLPAGLVGDPARDPPAALPHAGALAGCRRRDGEGLVGPARPPHPESAPRRPARPEGRPLARHARGEPGMRRIPDLAATLSCGWIGCAWGSSAPTPCPAATSRMRKPSRPRGGSIRAIPWRDTRRRFDSSPAAATGASACSR